MSERLSAKAGWQRARALKLHEHFMAISGVLNVRGAKLTEELKRVARILDGKELILPQGGTFKLRATEGTLTRLWYEWQAGGPKDHDNPANRCKPEALIPAYKAGCGGHTAMPAKLVAEIQRRITHPTGGRDKNKRAPISTIYDQLCREFLARSPLPGIDYSEHEEGAEFPWSYDTVCRAKPPKTLRLAGNVGRAAHKAAGAYVSLNYSQLRKCELCTLDDVRLDIVCVDEQTGKAIEVIIYVLMEVASRMIVAYVLRPAAAIRQEDVDELVAYSLQTPGFGIGIGYVTHIKFERGAVACSEATQAMLEGVTDGRIKIHRTGMVGGVRWIGSAKDKASGNAAGKAVIESFNRRLHYSLLHLPAQRGNNFGNQPANLGDIGKGSFRAGERKYGHTLIDEAERLAEWNLASGGRLKLKLPMLYLMELNACVRAAIHQHNHEPGHDYQGHGQFAQAEVQRGVWQDAESPLATAPEPVPAAAKKAYVLHSAPSGLNPAQRNAMYWQAWNALEKAKPGISRHALTHRTLGCVKAVKDMTDQELAKVVSVFNAITRDSAETVPATL